MRFFGYFQHEFSICTTATIQFTKSIAKKRSCYLCKSQQHFSYHEVDGQKIFHGIIEQLDLSPHAKYFGDGRSLRCALYK